MFRHKTNGYQWMDYQLNMGEQLLWSAVFINCLLLLRTYREAFTTDVREKRN
jgi:hypothetical protein